MNTKQTRAGFEKVEKITEIGRLATLEGLGVDPTEITF